MKLVITFMLLVLAFSFCRQKPPLHEMPFSPYSKQALQEAVARHQPVVIDFWAEWCPNCHDLDRLVFSRPEIQAELAQVKFLRMDVTNQDDPNIQAIIQQYGLEGVPTVIFLDSRGKEVQDARLIGLVTPREFSEAFSMLKVLK